MKTTGFALESFRHGPHDSDRLAFYWINNGQQHCVEFAVIDQHPLIVAQSLKLMADRIEGKYHEQKQKPRRHFRS